MNDLPNIIEPALQEIDGKALRGAQDSDHPIRILMLYGSLRKRSFSRLATEEAAQILNKLGAEVKVFDPRGLPLPDSVEPDDPKVQELRNLAIWADGMVWTSPERHGAMTGIMKAQIDWLPLSLGGVRPTQGKSLAVMQGERRVSKFQCGQSNAYSGPLDADGNNPQPVLGCEGIHGVR